MNKEESMVKINACKNATNSSKKVSINVNTSETPILPGTVNCCRNKYTIAISPITTEWPAVMFANNLNINENGIVNIPNTSIGASTNLNGTGTPGIQKICFQ